jgi:Xaa-Pro aminopeptidase
MNEARLDEPAPFDTARLDSLLEDEGIDVLVATSKHNVQYLLGGYRFFFFDYMDAIGVSRYLAGRGLSEGSPRQLGIYRMPSREP